MELRNIPDIARMSKILPYAFQKMILLTITLKMADQGRSDFCVVFTTSLCARGSKKNVNKSAISNRTSLKVGIHALRTYLKLTCEYELHFSLNTEVCVAKYHGKKLYEA